MLNWFERNNKAVSAISAAVTAILALAAIPAGLERKIVSEPQRVDQALGLLHSVE